MNKQLLIKQIEGDATPEENRQVIEWIAESKDNESYYISLLNLQAEEGALDGAGDKDYSAKELDDRLASIEKGKRRINWKALSGIAAAILLASLALNVGQYFSAPKKKQTAYVQPSAVPEHSIYTEKGTKGKTILPDGSTVWLNSDSRLTYPDKFASDVREVHFSGEAVFEVVKNPEWPMTITTDKGMQVKVLGTRFHIRSYDDEEDEQATLFEGHINITKRIGSEEIHKDLVPMQTFSSYQGKSPELLSDADTLDKIAWKQGELVFQDTPMEEVEKMLERWHGMPIVTEDSGVLSYRLTARFKSESMVQILEMIKFTTPIDYRIQNDTIHLTKRKI